MFSEIIILLFVLAFICEFIDSSFGMMYGTILSPVLIIYGYNPLVVVPAILFSQMIGGFTASIFHHKFQNADFSNQTTESKFSFNKIKELGFKEYFAQSASKDFKVAFAISVFGIFATILAALIAINIPKIFLKGYIGVLVLMMGVVLLIPKIKFKFSWRKILILGSISAFNKGLSGGGFGPVVTSGQIISGNNSKNSIASTTLAEAPICLVGFLTYLIIGGAIDWSLVLILSLGAVLAAPLGALLTSKMKEKNIRPVLGISTVLLGLWTLYKVIL